MFAAVGSLRTQIFVSNIILQEKELESLQKLLILWLQQYDRKNPPQMSIS